MYIKTRRLEISCLQIQCLCTNQEGSTMIRFGTKAATYLLLTAVTFTTAVQVQAEEVLIGERAAYTSEARLLLAGVTQKFNAVGDYVTHSIENLPAGAYSLGAEGVNTAVMIMSDHIKDRKPRDNNALYGGGEWITFYHKGGSVAFTVSAKNTGDFFLWIQEEDDEDSARKGISTR